MLRDQDGLSEKEFLAQYNAGDYPRPSVTVDMIMFAVADIQKDNYRKLPEKSLEILLIKRGGHPYLNSWALPGGFVQPTESTEEAAVRELEEETGVSNVYLEQVHTFSTPRRDPRTWVMSCAYMALIDSRQIQLQAGDDAADAKWFQIFFHQTKEEKVKTTTAFVRTKTYELILTHGDITLTSSIQQVITSEEHYTKQEFLLLENNGLAFDHSEIIAYGIMQLRNKVENTNLALHLMPPLFTLTQLQQVYEVITGTKLLKASFRRKAAPLVLETDEFTENAGHRPSRLYRRNREEDSFS